MSDAAWKAERDEHAQAQTLKAQAFVGKAIAAAGVGPHDDECDGVNRLTLTFTDGTSATVEGAYGDYTGHSCDEYVEFVSLRFTPEVHA